MTLTTRSSLLALLMAIGAIGAAPVAAAESSGTVSIDARLERLTQAIQARQQAEGSVASSEGLLLARFANGSRGSAYSGPRGRGFANGHGHYGGNRSFVNGGGGFRNGGFRNGGFRNGSSGRGFVNW